MLYACDARWWNVYGREVNRKFRGELWAGDPRMRDRTNVIEVVDGSGLSTNPRRVYNGWNGGNHAIGLVYHWSPAKIVLLGYDMQKTDGKLHHHGKHDGSLPNLGTMDEWVRRMTPLAMDLLDRGVRVINASRETALTCFDRMSLEAALSEGNG